MAVYELLPHLGVAHHDHLAYGYLDEIAQTEAHKHGHGHYDHDIDYLDKSLVPAESEPIEKTMNVRQQPLGHRVRRDNVCEYHKRALNNVILSLQRPQRR